MKKKWFIGIDISKKRLDVALYSGSIQRLEPCNYLQIANNEDSFKQLLTWFKKKKITLKGLVVLMEHTGIYSFDLCLFLENRGIDYTMASPLHLTRSMGFKRGKNDKVDAFRLACYCYTHRDTLVYTKLKDSTIIQLRELSSEHKR